MEEGIYFLLMQKINRPLAKPEAGVRTMRQSVQERAIEPQSDEEVLALHGKTFHFATRFFPAELRSPISTLYAFFRTLDDLVDEPTGDRTQDDVHAELEAWQDWFLHERQGVAPRAELGGRLSAILEARPIPSTLFLDFLAGLASDLDRCEISTFEELSHYCYGVAGTVGLAMAHLLGVRSEQALCAAKQLGIAMQMTNILRDVGSDLARGRLYLPSDERERFGLTRAYLLQLYTECGAPDEQFRVMMREQVARAHAYYAQGLHGIWLLPADCRFPVLVAGRLYRRILTVIERQRYDVLQGRACTTMLEKLGEAAIALLLHHLWRHGEAATLLESEALL